MRVFEAIAEALRSEGVEQVFCVLGDGNLDLMVELAERHGVDLVHARHEQGAVAMADGYSRRSGRIGVCSVTHGPGLTQTATSVKVAVEHGSRLLVLAGDTPTTDPTHIQSFEQRPFIESLGAAAVPLRAPSRWAADLAEAVGSAAAGRPAVFTAPTDHQLAEAPDMTYAPVHDLSAPTCAAASELGDAAEELASAARPAIVAGRGARTAAGMLAQLADRIGAPVVTTLGAKGFLAEHPSACGMIGGLGDPRALEVLSDADWVLSVGASLNPWSTKGGSLLRGARLIQLDHSPAAFDRFAVPDIRLLGDAGATLRRLIELLPEREPWAAPEAAEPDETRYEDGEESVDPRRALAAIEAALPADRTLVFDGGHFITFACSALTVASPERFLFSCDFATVGQGLASAIGASVARPADRTTLIAGDGGLLMSIAELDTAVRRRLPLNVVVLNDEAYGQEVHSLAAKGLPTRHAIFAVPDLGSLARGFGAEGYRIRTPDELEGLSYLLTADGGPRLIDVRVNRSVVSPAAAEIFRQVREALPA